MKEKKTSIIPRSKKTNKEFLTNHIEYLNLPHWGKKNQKETETYQYPNYWKFM